MLPYIVDQNEPSMPMRLLVNEEEPLEQVKLVRDDRFGDFAIEYSNMFLIFTRLDGDPVVQR